MHDKKLFIFDLDGTLVDAYEAIEKSLNFTLTKLGYSEVSYREVKRTVGKGDKLFIKAFFPAKHRNAALRIYRRHHRKSLVKYARCLPFAGGVLFSLKQQGKIVALASNRPSQFTGIILESTGIKKYFNYVLCADQINSLKPKPKILNVIVKKFRVAKKDSIYVGDMAIDARTAQAAGIDFVYVRGGSSNLSEVKKYKIVKIISSLKMLMG
jgi:phosphoglycolate phosphatase